VRALEGILAVYSYAAGYAPSQEDARLLRAVKAHSVDLTQLPNVSRWARQVASYTAEEVQAWQ
jgi:glutathione S-transferase